MGGVASPWDSGGRLAPKELYVVINVFLTRELEAGKTSGPDHGFNPVTCLSVVQVCRPLSLYMPQFLLLKEETKMTSGVRGGRRSA